MNLYFRHSPDDHSGLVMERVAETVRFATLRRPAEIRGLRVPKVCHAIPCPAVPLYLSTKGIILQMVEKPPALFIRDSRVSDRGTLNKMMNGRKARNPRCPPLVPSPPDVFQAAPTDLLHFSPNGIAAKK